MKKLLVMGILGMSAVSLASEGRINQDRQVTVNSRLGASRLSEYGRYHEISADYLFLKSGNTFYGLTAGWMANRFDDSGTIDGLNSRWNGNPYEKGDFNVDGLLLGAAVKHYLTSNIILKGTAGYQWGSSEEEVTDKAAGYKEEIKSDMTSPFASLELGYEFDNGIALGTFYKVSRVEYSTSFGSPDKKTNQVWGLNASYTL